MGQDKKDAHAAGHSRTHAHAHTHKELNSKFTYPLKKATRGWDCLCLH